VGVFGCGIQELMARRSDSEVVRAEASHAASISQPDVGADLILDAAVATR
jgi:hypothetical protein